MEKIAQATVRTGLDLGVKLWSPKSRLALLDHYLEVTVRKPPEAFWGYQSPQRLNLNQNACDAKRLILKHLIRA